MVEKSPKASVPPALSGFVDDYLAYLLARASHLVSSEFHRRLAGRGLDVPTWRVLATLTDNEGRLVGELADMVLLKQPTLSKALDRMIRDGLVKRAGSMEDRRQVKVTISAKGRTLVEGLIKEARAHENTVMARYSNSERDSLKAMLKTLIDRLSGAAGQ